MTRARSRLHGDAGFRGGDPRRARSPPGTGCARSTPSRRGRPGAATACNPRRCSSLAERIGLPVRSPASLRDDAAQAEFAALGADAAVVAAYGLILPPPILAAPRLGCLNVHASLLPRWRGAAPIQRAILAGDRETGVTIMQMEEGLDTGPILLQEAVPIAPRNDRRRVDRELAELGGRLMLEALDGVARGHARCRAPQPAEGVTYAPKIRREEARLDWRRRRPMAGAPGARFRSVARRLFRAAAASASGCCAPRPTRRSAERARPAPCSTTGSAIACGEGVFRPLRLQRPGRARARRRRLSARLSDPARDGAAVPRYKLTIEYDGTGPGRLAAPGQRPLGAGGARNRVRAVLRRAADRVRRRAHRCRGACAGADRACRSRARGRSRRDPRRRSTTICGRMRSACSPPSAGAARFRRAAVGARPASISTAS